MLSSPDAVCNDGTNASIYYSSPQDSASKKWLLYFEGGDLCTSSSACTNRPAFRGTSSGAFYPPSWPGSDLLGPDASSTFSDFHLAYVPHCSSDLYLADIPVPVRLNGAAFHFHGDRIARAAFEFLEKRGSDNESQIIIGGSSVGGLGAINHGIRLRQEGRYPRIAVLLDSSMIIDHDNILSEQMSSIPFLHYLPASTCKKKTNHVVNGVHLPCCMLLPCVLREFVIPLGIPTFLVNSASDFFTFSLLVQSSASHPDFDFKKKYNNLRLQLDMYSGALNYSFADIQGAPSISVFQPGCAQHQFFRNMDFPAYQLGEQLWSVPAHADALAVVYKNSNRSGLWKRVKTNGVLLSTALDTWVKSSYAKQVIFETCRGFVCNPTCSDSFAQRLGVSEPSVGIRAFITALVVFSLLAPLLIKVSLKLRAILVEKQASILLRETEKKTPSFARSISSFLNPLSQPASKIPFHPRRGSKSDCSLKGECLSLSCRNVSCRVPAPPTDGNDAGEKTILNKVTVEFQTGELVGLLGPSGSGKTSLLHVLANRTRGFKMTVRIVVCFSNRWYKEKSKDFCRLAFASTFKKFVYT